MFRGIYQVAQGMVYESLRADILANNLANVNSTGYKKSRLQVTSSFKTYYNNILSGYVETKPSANPYEFPELMFSRYDIDFAEGTLKETGNELDVAITGRGFFGVQSIDSSTFYTRDGTFKADAQGNLLNQQNLPVLDRRGQPIQLPTDAKQLTILPTGQIFADNKEVASLMIVDFSEPYPLSKIGGNLFEISKSLLFSMELGFQSDLDNGAISEELRQTFEEKGLPPLSQNATVSLEASGSRWLITDNEHKYTVKKEADELNIYNYLEAQPILLAPESGSFQIMQGFVETSNVNVIHEMIQMIETLRNFEGYQHAIRAFDDTVQQLNETAQA